MYDEFFAKANELMQKGEPFVTATVVRAERPTSGKPGDKAIVTINGVMHGWVGGSCAQPTVIQESLRALADDECRLIRLSTDPGGQTPRTGLLDMEMTCFSGGTLEIYIEPQRPMPRLMIIGNLPVAQALAHLGKAMSYHVIAVDPDHNGAGMAHADELVTDLDAIPSYVSPLTYVVIATHGNYDEVALGYALKANAPYIGLVASNRRTESVREYLKFQGFDENDLLAFKAPAGLDIQARRGDEIALSIMAEIVQKRRNAELLDIALLRSNDTDAIIQRDIKADANGEASCGCGNTAVIEEEEAAQAEIEESGSCCGGTAVAEKETAQAETETSCCGGSSKEEMGASEEQLIAIDPICQMSVTIATAKHIYEHDGVNYYFCCGGCLTKFARSKEVQIQDA